MKIIRHTEAATAAIGSIGGKAWHLARLEQAGLSVPGWKYLRKRWKRYCRERRNPERSGDASWVILLMKR